MTFEFAYAICPHCGTVYQHFELMSYTTHGENECWSDGYRFATPQSTHWRRCSQCQNVFWRTADNYLLRHQLPDTSELRRWQLQADKKMLVRLAQTLSKETTEPERFENDYFSFDMHETYASELNDALDALKCVPDNEHMLRFVHQSILILSNHFLRYPFRISLRHHIMRPRQLREYLRERKQRQILHKKYAPVRRQSLQALLALCTDACTQASYYQQLGQQKQAYNALQQCGNEASAKYRSKMRLAILFRRTKPFRYC